MAKPDKEQVKTARERLLERAQGRFPDRQFVRPEGQEGQDGQLADLDEAINEMMDADASQIAENAEMNKKLADLLYSDPQAATFLNLWIETGDPRPALIEAFGDEMAELATEEGRKQFMDNWKNYRERVDESKRLREDEDKNWNDFLERLNSWGDERGLSNDDKAAVAVRLIDIKQKGNVNMYDETDMETVWQGIRYKDDVEAARNEGLIAGRNERIEASRRTRGTAERGTMPSINGGRGGSMPKPEPPKPYNPWDEIS